MTHYNKSVIYGLYNDENDLLEAVKVANSKHLEIMDVYSPFPVHGLDPLLGLSESRLHIGGFIYGLLGTATAFFLELAGSLPKTGQISLAESHIFLFQPGYLSCLS